MTYRTCNSLFVHPRRYKVKCDVTVRSQSSLGLPGLTRQSRGRLIWQVTRIRANHFSNKGLSRGGRSRSRRPRLRTLTARNASESVPRAPSACPRYSTISAAKLHARVIHDSTCIFLFCNSPSIRIMVLSTRAALLNDWNSRVLGAFGTTSAKLHRSAHLSTDVNPTQC
jgi:hypothetical protein